MFVTNIENKNSKFSDSNILKVKKIKRDKQLVLVNKYITRLYYCNFNCIKYLTRFIICTFKNQTYNCEDILVSQKKCFVQEVKKWLQIFDRC